MVSSLLVRRAASVSFAGVTLGLISSAIVGCGSNTVVPPQVYVDATIGPTTTNPTDATACMMATGTQFLQIGTVNGDAYSLVKNDETFDGATVQVSCSVTPSGSGFAVDATAVRSGSTTGGTVHIVGTFTASGDQSAITATFGNGSNGVYQQIDGCTATYTQSVMGVAAGRVWGILSCPAMQLEGQANICASQSEFRFENCGQ